MHHTNFLDTYQITIFLLGSTGLLFLVQLMIADFAGIKAKHKPGFPITADHKLFFFRAARVIANSNESAVIYLIAVIFALLSAASPAWVNGFSVLYFIGRVAHMLCYYFSLGLARSISFSLSIAALFGMFAASIVNWV